MSTVESIGQLTASTLLTQLGTPGGNNTKGAWTQIVASTSNDATGFYVSLLTGGIEIDCLFDVAVGASSSEVAIVSNVYVRALNTVTNHGFNFFIPVAIASGARVSMRYQATNASAVVFASLYLIKDSSGVPLASCTANTYGASTADSGSTSVDPGGTVNTKGAYSQLTASSSADLQWLAVVAGGVNNGGMATSWWLVDIATGAAASEVVVISNVFFHSHSALQFIDNSFIGPFPVIIPSGTRIAARAQCLQNDATDRLIDIQVIGFGGTPAAGGGGAFFSAAMLG